MPIIYPKMFCPKGTILESIEDIVIDNNYIINKGNKLSVVDIIGYGYDISFVNINTNECKTIRILNSKMHNLFKIIDIPDTKLEVNLTYDGNVILKKDIIIDDVILYKTGSKLSYLKESGFYELYNTYYKVARFNQKEFYEYAEMIK